MAAKLASIMFKGETSDRHSLISSRSGSQVFLHSKVWKLTNGLNRFKLDFAAMNTLSPTLLLSFRYTLAWYVTNRSESYTRNLFEQFSRFASFLKTDQVSPECISSADLLNYRADVGIEREWYVGAVAVILRKWVELEHPGLSEDAKALLKEITLKGNAKGVAVATMDAHDGPFDDIEFATLQSRLLLFYESGEITASQFLICQLSVAFALRPIQVCAMKLGDVYQSRFTSAETTQLIRVPRAKQRYQRTRGSFKLRRFAPEFVEILDKYVNELRKAKLPVSIEADDRPLFMTSMTVPHLSGFELHMGTHECSRILKNTIAILNIRSTTTGNSLHVNHTRFRRTLGTRAAEEGLSALVIAELLDHSDTQHVLIYTGTRPNIVEKIDLAVAQRMAPLAHAFLGRLIKDESEATRAGDTLSRIADPHLDDGFGSGSCGSTGGCALSAPRACYTCVAFEPWLDGPHEQLLRELIFERERLLQTCDRRIAAINDRTILAVQEVVNRCIAARDQGKPA